jgi:hypothetical protein
VAATAVPLGADTPRTASASGGDYVTTTTPSAPSLDVSGFSPVCIGDAPFISYAIVPVGFTPVDQSATLVIRAADGTVIGTENVDGLRDRSSGLAHPSTPRATPPTGRAGVGPPTGCRGNPTPPTPSCATDSRSR